MPDKHPEPWKYYVFRRVVQSDLKRTGTVEETNKIAELKTASDTHGLWKMFQ